MKKIIIGIAAAGLLLAGCSSGSGSTEATEFVGVVEETSAPASVEESPSVTEDPTRLPTDAEIMQGCLDFKVLADMFGITDAEGLIALAQIDESDSTDTVTVETGDGVSWKDATPLQQAAVRKAAEMATSGGC